MTLNKAVGYMGVAIQSARGTAASAAQFKFPIYSGDIFPSRSLNEDRMASASRNQSDPYIDGISVDVEFETKAYVGLFVMLMQAVMGTRNTSGASDPYSHAISTGASLPYLTFFISKGPSDAHRSSAQDVKLDALDVTWGAPGAVRLKVTGKGTQCDMTAADFDNSAVSETDATGYFTTIGATLQYDAVGTTAADIICPSGGIRFENSLIPVGHAAQLAPYDHDEDLLAVGFDLSVNADNLNDVIEIITGSSSGSNPTGDVQFGKANIVLQEAGTGTHTATFTASRVPWEVAPAGVDGGNRQTTLEMTGAARYNATESDALDVTITNGHAGTVYAAA